MGKGPHLQAQGREREGGAPAAHAQPWLQCGAASSINPVPRSPGPAAGLWSWAPPPRETWETWDSLCQGGRFSFLVGGGWVCPAPSHFRRAGVPQGRRSHAGLRESVARSDPGRSWG